MSDIKLDPVTRTASTRTRASGDERQDGQQQQQRRQRQPASLQPTLLARLLPGRNPADLLVDTEVGPGGEADGVVITDRASGRVLMRLSRSALERFQGDDNPGTLVEQRG